MTPIDLGFLVLSVLFCAAFFLLGAVSGRFHRDEIFRSVTPGLLPAPGQESAVERVGPGREYSGEVAVAFSPPRGLHPGLIGTVVDGEAEMRDVMATFVDLAIRGHLRIKAIDGAARPARRGKPAKAGRDWELTLVAPKPADKLEHFEVSLLQSMFGAQLIAPKTARMSAWIGNDSGHVLALRREFYRQTVENGWYPRDPSAAGKGPLPALVVGAGVVWSGLMLVSSLGWVTLLSTALVMGGAAFAYRKLGRRVPRTAAGTAVQIQALGFKKYLATAEADQIRTQEQLGVFERYLPYALVFGVADHWAKVFGDVVTRDSAMLDAGVDALMWIDLGTHALDGLALAFEAGELVGGVLEIADGVGGVAEAVGGLVEGVGDFLSILDV
ncbi:MAG TPA: DUF2207 domain-containing protein [Arachnia sp.]|nr:DUF2207 domain-containing protein [Arachnia sp.]HMR12586.1 DUF2207 domain-containing protein [Arachnia sp.]